MRVLVSGGATREPIDAVRFITNFSTGKTAASLVTHLARKGHSVTYLRATGAAQAEVICRELEYDSYYDLDSRFRELLADEPFDLIVHLAAVGDYSVDGIEGASSRGGKIDSAGDITLKLRRNPKIVSQLKSYARVRKPVLVAFKLTHTECTDEQFESVVKLGADRSIDLVVHNDLAEMRSSGVHRFSLYQGALLRGRCESTGELAEALEKFSQEFMQ